MIPPWKAGEGEFLIRLATHGPDHQSSLAEALSIPPPTLNIAKDSLLGRGYIRLAGTVPMGPGAPRKVYGLTPAGVISAVFAGGLWGDERVLERWGRDAPVFIERFRSFDARGLGFLVKDTSVKVLEGKRNLIEMIAEEIGELVCFMPSEDVILFANRHGDEGHPTMDPWVGLRILLDWGYFDEMYYLMGAEKDGYLEVLRGDEVLRDGWVRWFGAKRARLSILEGQMKIISRGIGEE